MKKLILWDIDGTLVDAGGAGVRALLGAMKACFNIDVSDDGIEMAGRTDLDIIDEMFGVYRAGCEEGDPSRCAGQAGPFFNPPLFRVWRVWGRKQGP